MTTMTAPLAVGWPVRAHDLATKPEPMDEAAFRAFYERHGPRLLSYLRRIAGVDAHLAEDFLQESFYRFLRSSFAAESEDHCRNYLYRIAINLVRDHFRKVGRGPLEVVELADELTASRSSSPAVSARSLDLDRVLARLQPRDRQLLWLAHVEGMTHDEIANALGLKSSSIRSMLFRARQRCGVELERAGGVA